MFQKTIFLKLVRDIEALWMLARKKILPRTGIRFRNNQTANQYRQCDHHWLKKFGDCTRSPLIFQQFRTVGWKKESRLQIVLLLQRIIDERRFNENGGQNVQQQYFIAENAFDWADKWNVG